MTNEQSQRNDLRIKAAISDMKANIISVDNWFIYLRRYEDVLAKGINEISLIKEYGFYLISALIKKEETPKYDAIYPAKEAIKKVFTISKEYGNSKNQALIILLFQCIRKNDYVENNTIEKNYVKKNRR